MAEGNLSRAQFTGGTVQDTATQTRTERAGGFAFRNLLFDDPVGVFFDNFVLDAKLLEIFRQNVGGKTRLLLIEVDRDQRE